MLPNRPTVSGLLFCGLTVIFSFFCIAADRALGQDPAGQTGTARMADPAEANATLFQPAKAKFANGQNALNIPFQSMGGHIVLPIRIDGSREMSIVLDTGMPVPGLALTRPELADELKLSLNDSPIMVSGGGEGALMSIRQSPGHSLSLPGVRFDDQRIDVMSRSLPGQGEKEGIIGNTILESCIVEIDYVRQVVNLYDPLKHDLRGEGEVVPIQIGPGGLGRTLSAQISLDGLNEMPLLLALDLGLVRNLILFPTARLPFTPPDPRKLEIIGRGIRGEVRGYARPLHHVRLGPVVLRDLEAHFQNDEGVPFPASAGIEGVLGHGTLRQFDRVILDYSRDCMVMVDDRASTK